MKKIIILIFISLTLISCGEGGTTTGNPIKVQMSFNSYNNSFARVISNLFIKQAHADLTELRLCFKRVRFKTTSSSSAGDIELELGEVSINQEGTDLGEVEISDTTYRRIEFDIDKNCDDTSKPSIQIMNDNGTFTSDDHITIKFEGEFKPSDDGDLDMYVQNIVDSVKNYQLSDGELKEVLEEVSGSF